MPYPGPTDPSKVLGSAGQSSASTDQIIITTESLTTAAGATYSHTHYNPEIHAYGIVLASIKNGTNSQGDPSLQLVTNTFGQAVITIVNRHATQAFNGTLVISLVCHK